MRPNACVLPDSEAAYQCTIPYSYATYETLGERWTNWPMPVSVFP